MAKINAQPDVDEVLQTEEETMLTVPVCITEQKSPVRTQGLPRKGGATFTKTVGTTPLQVLWPDPRRAGFTLTTTDTTKPFLIAFTQTGTQDPSTMSVWPGAVPFPGDMRTEVWVAAATGTVTLGVTTSLWADGE